MKKNYSFISPIGPIIVRYISLKQALGRQCNSYRILKQVDSFLYAAKSNLTEKSYTDWCHTRQHMATGVQNESMRIVRNLCLYRRRTEPKCFVPDKTQFPKPHQSIQPHIFTETEISHLLDATKYLNSSSIDPMRQENFKLALVLLYTTGLRRGELCKLTIGDYNSTEHTLLIRESKFYKSRLLPLSHDAWKEVENYLKIRYKQKLPMSKNSALIWGKRNGNYKTKNPGFYTGDSIRRIFNSVFRKINIRTVSGHTPRVHDLRHCFAVHALLRWYREGANVQAKLPSLSIYMGHVDIKSTAYYLRFIEEVVGSASERFEKCYGVVVTKFNKSGEI